MIKRCDKAVTVRHETPDHFHINIMAKFIKPNIRQVVFWSCLFKKATVNKNSFLFSTKQILYFNQIKTTGGELSIMMTISLLKFRFSSKANILKNFYRQIYLHDVAN